LEVKVKTRIKYLIQFGGGIYTHLPSMLLIWVSMTIPSSHFSNEAHLVTNNAPIMYIEFASEIHSDKQKNQPVEW
jgi:hypothetical protein